MTSNSYLPIFVVVFLVVCLGSLNSTPLLREKRQNPVTPICGMNICDFSSPCLNDGTCLFNWTTCTIRCGCSVGYSGVYCEQKIGQEPTSTTTTPSPPTNSSEDTTLSVELTLSSSSNITSTNLPINSTTSRTTAKLCGLNLCKFNMVCLNGGTCLFTSSCQIRCECTQNYTGQNCEIPLSQDFTSTITVTTDTIPTLRPLENRSCQGFVCFHGVCDSDMLAKGLYKCACDGGFSGTFCETRCKRNCSVNGICRLNKTTHLEYCDCGWPYIGENCEKIMSKKLVEAGWKWWVLGSCTLLLMLLLVLLPCWMWHKRDVLFCRHT